MSTKYSSFNVLGISLILLLGGWIVVLDMTLEPLIAWYQKRRHRNLATRNPDCHNNNLSMHAILEWSATSTLQLQRLAHEKAGYGKWDNCDDANPVTMLGETLGLLDVEDLTHPVLKHKGWRTNRTGTGLDTLVEQDIGEKKKMEELDVILKITDSPGSSFRERS